MVPDTQRSASAQGIASSDSLWASIGASTRSFAIASRFGTEGVPRERVAERRSRWTCSGIQHCHKFGFSLFQLREFPLETSYFCLHSAQFRLRVSLLQIVHAIFFMDQAFHLLAQQLEAGIAIKCIVTILEFALSDRRNNIFVTQTKLFLCRCVTERRPFLDPNGTVVCMTAIPAARIKGLCNPNHQLSLTA